MTTMESEYTPKKEVINVLIDVNNIPGAKKTPDGSGYQGILYDIWKLVRDKLQNKYTFVEHFRKLSSAPRVIHQLSNGEYDIVIAPMQKTLARIKKVNFTNNIIVNKHTILHLPIPITISTFKMVTNKLITRPLVLSICISIILGLLLYWIEPIRFIKARTPKLFARRRTLLSTSASLFGEAGFLSENSTMSIAGISMVIFIIIVSFFIMMIMQALITDKVLNLQKNSYYNIHNIKGKVLLCQKGYTSGSFMARYGAKIKYYDKTNKDIIDIYIKNPTKYIGVILETFDAIGELQSNNKLVISRSDFGFLYIYWIINKRKLQLLTDVNMALFQISFNYTKYSSCKQYLSHDNSYLCN